MTGRPAYAWSPREEEKEVKPLPAEEGGLLVPVVEAMRNLYLSPKARGLVRNPEARESKREVFAKMGKVQSVSSTSETDPMVTKEFRQQLKIELALLNQSCSCAPDSSLIPLGEGAFSQVYLFSFKGKSFAVRVIHNDMREKPCVQRERLLTSTIPPHQNIAKTYYSMEMSIKGAKHLVYVMEYYPGEDLSYLRKYRFPKELFVDQSPRLKSYISHAEFNDLKNFFSFQKDLARDMAHALQHLQSYNLVHRDIKPSNIMSVKDPSRESGYRFILVDMGLVRSMETYTGLMPAQEKQLGCDVPPLPLTPRAGTKRFASPKIYERRPIYSPETEAVSLGKTLLFTALSRVLAPGIYYHSFLSNPTLGLLGIPFKSFLNDCICGLQEKEEFTPDKMLKHSFLTTPSETLVKEWMAFFNVSLRERRKAVSEKPSGEISAK